MVGLMTRLRDAPSNGSPSRHASLPPYRYRESEEDIFPELNPVAATDIQRARQQQQSKKAKVKGNKRGSAPVIPNLVQMDSIEMETELGWVAAFMTKHLNLLQQKRNINSN